MNRRIATDGKSRTGSAAAPGYRLVDKISFVFGAMIVFMGALILLGQGAGLLALLH